jgi:hypothetical protein
MMPVAPATGMVFRVRIAGGLIVAAVVGFLLGACGGGGGGGSSLGPVSGATVTRAPETTAAQPTLPTRTRTVAAPGTTADTTTVSVTTTAPTTTRPSLTVTVVPATTSTTTPAAVTPPPATTAAETSSSNDTPWGWIALVLALAGVIALVLGLWSRRRSRASSWSTHLADLSRRTLVALDDVRSQGSVVTGQIQALEAEARSLERHAPDERAAAAAAQLRAGLEELVGALEGDRALRLASPPPSEEQLAYSSALIRQQAEQLQGVLRSPPVPE